LLALLALHANELVPSERLVSALFGVDAADASVNSLQVALSRLRRALGDGLIQRRPGGYLLQLSPAALDTARFERLVAEGRTLLQEGDAVAAGAVLRDALGLFHGSPLADIASFDFAQEEIRRLEGLRIAGLLDRIDADLAAGRGADLVPELEALTREHPLQERLRGQLMLALYRSGRQSDALDAYRDTRQLLGEELGLEPSLALRELELAILRQDPTLDRREPPEAVTSAVDSGVVVCPFKGLAPFGAPDARYFFGRERAVDQLIAHLAASSFVGLIGPSGSGKSSLLQAGLLTALAAGALPGSGEWRQYLVRPGDGARIDLPEPPSHSRLVVAVDQLEELFTSPLDEARRVSFVSALAAAALDPAGRFVVVVSLRADFYGRCAAYDEFAALLSSNHILLTPMKRDELARAIERPAREAGLEVEHDLVDALVSDVEGEPGALPLLSTSLLELWLERDGRSLTYDAYRLSGGLHGAVGRLGEHAYAALTPDEQAIARVILMRLAVEEDGTFVRRRMPREELELVQASTAERVISALTDARLLTASEGMLEVSHEALLSEWPRLRDWLDEDRDGRRLHAHLAAAAREWNARSRDAADLYRGPRLSSVLDWTRAHDAELNRVEREFVDESRFANEREAARERRRNRRLKSLLVGVAALLVLAIVAGVVAAVARSRSQHEATIALARELGAEAVSAPRVDEAMLLAGEAVRLNRSMQTEGTLLATLLRSPNVLGTITSPILSRPQHISISPDGRTLAVSDNLDTVRFYDTATLRLRHVARELGYTYAVAYYPDGTKLAAFGGPTPRIDIVDARTFHRLRTLEFDPGWSSGPTGCCAPPLVTPDGRMLVFVYDLLRPDGSDGAARLDRWNLQTGHRFATVTLPIDGASDATILDHGRRLAVGGTHALAIFDLRSLRLLRRVPLASTSAIDQASLSPDGRTVAAGAEDGSVSFVDVSSGRRVSASGGTAGIRCLQFAPDARTLVTTSEDGSVVVWDSHTGRALTRLVGHEGLVHSCAFGPHGRTLFTSSLDGAIFEWAVGAVRRFGVPFSSPSRPPPFDENSFAAPPLAVSATGSTYADAAGRSTVDLFDTGSGKRSATFRVHSPLLTSLAFSPRAPLLAVTGADGVVQLWRVASVPRLVRTFGGLRSFNEQPESVATVAFSPDGRLLAAGDVDHTPASVPYRFGSVAVWDVATGRRLWQVRNRLGWVHTVAFSPSGRLLAAAQESGGARIYDAHTGRLERALRLYGGAQADGAYDTLAFAPNGTLATGTWNGILQLWNPSTGASIGRPTLVASAPVSSIAFAPSGKVLATTGGSDGLTKVWTTQRLQRFGADLPGSRGSWGNALYTPDGSKLVAVDADGHGVIWPASLDAWMQHACSVAGRNFTREEWARFVGKPPYAQTCGAMR
jgi:WD40 repeat protein/DNA-binding SARP family transcriptional activator